MPGYLINFESVMRLYSIFRGFARFAPERTNMFSVRRNILIFLLTCKSVMGQEGATERRGVGLQLCTVCTCGEINSEIDADVTSDVIFNIQCSEIDRIESLPDLRKIQWPDNPNGLKITATFRDLSLSTLGKLPGNLYVETLYFNNNAIKTYWPNPFSDLPNLKILSLSQNDLVEITQDLLADVPKLEVLDLSYNKLIDFNRLDFASLYNLRKLNLQSNSLKKIPVDSLENITSLEDLDLSKNGIYDILLERSETVSLRSVKRLTLSGNRIRSITQTSFPHKNFLELLDLSSNIIENIEESAFLVCENLRELNLGQNNLTTTFALPTSLEIIILRQNALHRWPKLPNGIKYVDLSLNKIDELYNENTDFDNLEVLNISGNQLKEFNVQRKIPKLFSLDISYNLLEEVPASLSTQNFPNLEELKLDGNPIHNIYFKNILTLKYLHVNNLDSLSVVEDKAFSNVAGRDTDSIDDSENDKNCFSLFLSNSRSLVQIEKGAFEGVSLCFLDLSNNNLTHLSEDLLLWSELRDGIDLQGNPWDCTCNLQWIMKILLPDMYKRYPQFLTEFRCQSPRAVQGLRLVHWYNWTEDTMCSGTYMRSGSLESYIFDSTSNSGSPPVSGYSLMEVILGAIVVLGVLIIVALMVVLIRGRRRYRVYRAAMMRKRQSNNDSKRTNGIHKDQYSALNRV